jgi:hypothetical protein
MPKTLFLAPGQMPGPARAEEGLSLGWLVVVSALDSQRQGSLIELNHDNSILSRTDASLSGRPGLFEFADIFMSSGHATVIRPRTGSRTDAFQIRDRESAPTGNGTFVNSHRLAPHEILRLADGDVIKLGTTEIIFRSLWLPGVNARAS